MKVTFEMFQAGARKVVEREIVNSLPAIGAINEQFETMTGMKAKGLIAPMPNAPDTLVVPCEIQSSPCVTRIVDEDSGSDPGFLSKIPWGLVPSILHPDAAVHDRLKTIIASGIPNEDRDTLNMIRAYASSRGTNKCVVVMRLERDGTSLNPGVEVSEMG